MATVTALSAIAHEYLETIYNITAEGDPVVGARLAERFGVSRPSVSEMLSRLERDGYLTLDHGRGATLTGHGVAAAEASLRRHRLAERFLFDILHMDWITAHEEAHAFQHALTPTTEAHLLAVLGDPTTCPHGNPIPGSAPEARTFLRAHHALRLNAASVGVPLQVLCISEVVEDETALLRLVGSVGLHPGKRLSVVDHNQTSSAVHIEDECAPIHLPVALASKMWVVAENEDASGV